MATNILVAAAFPIIQLPVYTRLNMKNDVDKDFPVTINFPPQAKFELDTFY